jgi:hypothetical protein
MNGCPPGCPPKPRFLDIVIHRLSLNSGANHLKFSLYQRLLYVDGRIQPSFDSYKDPQNDLLNLAGGGQFI